VDKLLGDANRAIFVGDFTQTGKTAGETENLFPEGYPLAAVRKAYGEIDLSFNAEEKQIPDIIDRLTALIPSAAPASCRRFRPTSSW
jgi:adenine/guanine phosphoribosyltransferase-like PRPP-binding protein